MDLKNCNVKFMASSDAHSAYINDLRKIEPPSTEEEEALFERIKNGDEKARKELSRRHQRFIYALAKRYAKDSSDVLDYVNEGTIGLLKAIDKFNPDLGYKFITFAVYYIRREMNYFMEVTNNTVKRPNNFKYNKKIENIKKKFVGKHGYEPSIEEIARMMKKEYGITIKDKSDLFSLNFVSISENAGGDSDDFSYEETNDYNERTAVENTFNDEIDNEYKNSKNRAIINKLLENIPEEDEDGNKIKNVVKRNLGILLKLYGIGYSTPSDIDSLAESYDVDKGTMRTLITNTINYLRQYNSHLKRFLPI